MTARTTPVERPPIGARVRVLGTTQVRDVAGRTGTVVRYHPDGVAIVVEYERTKWAAYSIVCEPSDVEVLESDTSAASPARVGGPEA